MNNKTLINSFETRLYKLSENDILIQSQHDDSGTINNLVVGLEKYFYGLSISGEADNLDYDLTFMTAQKELEGFILVLNSNLETRNELLAIFCKFLSDKYGLNVTSTFNTFQTVTRTHLEKIGFFTYDEKDTKPLEGKSFSMLIKPMNPVNFKRIAYTPFLSNNKQFEEQRETKTTRSEVKPVQNNINFIYQI